MAVRLSNKPAAFACSVLRYDEDGAEAGVDQRQALRLCAPGVHTVLCTD